jgi:dTDP-4-dehydrorhamnose 3,5-epimerase-like enzyme
VTIAKLYDFPELGDARGSLVVMDKSCGVPFDIKRAYYIFGTLAGVSRGFHAHKKLHQIAVCITGSCRMVLDDGVSREDVQLNSPFKGINLPPRLWHEMHDFSTDCVLLVLASDYYDEGDYVRDYSEFKELIGV